MIRFPNCKINLGLHITRKREDGYHDLQTVFYPLPLQDALECILAPDAAEPVVFSTSGLPVAGNMQDNLCLKAYYLLKQDFPQIGKVRIHLHKQIPMGAGLGGGSSDGAETLLLLDQVLRLNLSTDQLLGYALQLGSDCPFFIRNTPCIATGRGEQMQTLSLDLSGYRFLVVHPGIHISTREAFSGITPAEPLIPLADILQLPPEQWKDRLQNDFEAVVCSKYPEIGAVKQTMYDAGAVYASMSGSGSAVFGLFRPGYRAPVFPEQYSVYSIG